MQILDVSCIRLAFALSSFAHHSAELKTLCQAVQQIRATISSSWTMSDIDTIVQDINAELREEIRFNEQRRLEEWNAKENSHPKAPNSQRRPAGSASGSAASTAKKPTAAKPKQEASSKLAAASQPAAQAPAQSTLHADIGPRPTSQGSASDYDENDSEDEQAEGLFVQQGSPADAALAGQMPWHSQTQLQTSHGQSAHPASALHMTSQPSYAALHAQTGTQQQQASAQLVQHGNILQPIGSSQHTSSAWHDVASEQAWGDPSHAAVADRYSDAVVRSSAGGFLWQPMHPSDRHSISTTAAAASTSASQNLQAPSQMPFAPSAAETGVSSGVPYSSRPEAGYAAPTNDRSIGMRHTQQSHTQAAEQGLGSSTSWQELPQGSYGSAEASVHRCGAHTSYTGDMSNQQLGPGASDSLFTQKQRPATAQYAASAAAQGTAPDIWTQNGQNSAMVEAHGPHMGSNRYAEADMGLAPTTVHSNRHMPNAQSAFAGNAWQEEDVHPEHGLSSSDPRQGQAEQARSFPAQAGTHASSQAADSTMQVCDVQ